MKQFCMRSFTEAIVQEQSLQSTHTGAVLIVFTFCEYVCSILGVCQLCMSRMCHARQTHGARILMVLFNTSFLFGGINLYTCAHFVTLVL